MTDAIYVARRRADDLRRFQLHQRQNGVQASSMNSAVSALRFFFGVTLDRPDMDRHLTFVSEPRKLPVVLSPEEIARRRNWLMTSLVMGDAPV
jgi:integrase/recombinase XerD